MLGKEPRKPKIAGGIAIFAGTLTILASLFFIGLSEEWIMFGWAPLLGIIAIVGGYFATRIRRWTLAITGAVCATILPLFLVFATVVDCIVRKDYTDLNYLLFIVPGVIVGILAVILMTMSKEDFS